MKSFKYICAVLTLVTAITAAGCGESKPTDSSKAPFFELKENVTAESVSKTPVYVRYSAEYTSELTASENYGELAVFAGGFNVYASTEEGSDAVLSVPSYGLMTESGAVVVDAVYDSVIKHSTAEGKTVYELIKGSDGSDSAFGERWVAAGDGSWVFKMPKNTSVHSVGADRVVLKRVRTSRKVKYEYLDFYDFSGKRKFTLDKTLAESKDTEYTLGSFGEGLAPVNITVKTKGEKDDDGNITYTEEKSAYYIDNTGAIKLDNMTYCGEFKNGYAVAADENGLYGVLKPDGEWFIEPDYKLINYNADKGLFACADDGFYDILDMEKKSVKNVICTRGTVEVLSTERTVYKKTNADTGRTEYFYLDTGKPFTCIENGMFPDSGESIDGLYVGTYSGTGTVFDIDGNSIASIGDFGRLADRFQNTAVVVNSTDKKVCFVSVATKQRGEWLNMHYTGQSLQGRYLVLKTVGEVYGGYSLYDILTESFVLESFDYIEVTSSGEKEYISTVSDGVCEVFDSGLVPVMSVTRGSQH